MATADTTQSAENAPANPNAGKRKIMLLALAVVVALGGGFQPEAIASANAAPATLTH